MPLFTDGPASGIEDLAAQDSQLLNVASAEGIDVTAKLALAQEGIGIELYGLMRESVLALKGIEPLQRVIVTPPLRLWHTYRTLETVYRDAYNNQLNDRYAAKRNQFRELGHWAREQLRDVGVGLAARPVPRAASPTLQQADGTMPQGTYYATIAWMNEFGQEGCAAAAAAITLAGALVVILPEVPAGVTQWKVYAGTSPESMTEQGMFDIGQECRLGFLLSGGKPPGEGQAPDYLHPLPRVLQRG
jgi:hypothetical protein